MTTYIFNEMLGMYQGKMVYITASDVTEAVEKFGADEVISSIGVFSKMYFSDVYEVYEIGKPEKRLCIVHKAAGTEKEEAK